MTKFLSSASVAAIALALSGCATSTPQVLQSTDLPQGFEAPVAKGAPVWPSADWWTNFGSPELTGDIAIAQKDNLSLAAAYATVLQARANAGIAGAALWPSLSGDASAQRSGSKGGSSLAVGAPPTNKFVSQDQFSLGLDASYQLDLFGKNRDTLHAAEEAVRSSVYAQQVVELTVNATVANTYLDVLALRERVKIAQANLDAVNRILTIVKAKVQNGVSSNLDLAQEQAQAAAQEAQIPALKEQEREAKNALAVLLGRVPEGFTVAAQNLDTITPPVVAPGMPSEILLRRPDVAQAEATLASAHANVDAARAAFFPSIGLSGQGGVASSAIGSLFSGGFFYSLAAQALQTIFDGGLLSSESDAAKAVQLEDIANYRASVLNAFQDVERALGTASSLTEQERLLNIEVTNAAEAFRISELQYREGVTDLLTVLQAQQTLFTAQDTLVQIKLARRQASVGLYQALGGGWSADAKDNTQKIPASTVAVTREPAIEPAPAVATTPTPAPATVAAPVKP